MVGLVPRPTLRGPDIMFTVKICGITSVEDALAVAAAGADAIGLNFYRPSSRYIAEAQAREIIAALPPGIVKVGLFVNADAEHMCRMFDELGLDLLQLHGDEPPSMLEKLGGRRVMKAFRVHTKSGDIAAMIRKRFQELPVDIELPVDMDITEFHEIAIRDVSSQYNMGERPAESGPPSSAKPDKTKDELNSVVRYISECDRLGHLLRFVLLDAKVGAEYGGTGALADWPTARRYVQTVNYPPLVLAGGLTPDNVAAAIRATGASAVDTASGVELSPGKKNPAAVKKFVEAAKKAFAPHPGGA